MVLKIARPANMKDTGDGRLVEEDDHHHHHHQRQAKKQKVELPPPAPPGAVDADHGVPPPPSLPPMDTHRGHHQHQPPPPPSHHFCCAGCGVSESASSGPLLLFEDPEEDETQSDHGRKVEDEKRYCAGCMTDKRVRVFWPVDSQWYIADVQQYDTNTGEHLLRYPDGDTEWVRIGEDHTTNTQYKEYFKAHGDTATVGAGNTEGDLRRLPSLGNGVSFALSNMSQSFGMPTSAEDEKTSRLKPPSQQQRLFQQLNLDRTASSMSSFGMFNGGPPGMGTRQMSFGQGQGQHNGRAPPFQILSPNSYTHSFSSKIGTAPSMDYGPPPPHPGDRKAGEGGPPPLPYPHGPPHHHHQQQREEGSQHLSSTSPGTRDGAPGGHSWPPSNQYSDPNYYDNGGHHPPCGSYPAGLPPHDPSYESNKQAQQPPKSKPTPSTVKSSQISKKDSAKSRKALAKAWGKAEDEYLLDLVLQMKHPLKWSIIAQSLSDFSAGSSTPVRTGKQCRERYVNHLNPRLKHTEFTPLEDATIWRLYATVGTQWAKMSKVIPGRTDNNLKNRFHNLKRQLQREEDGRLRAPEPEGYQELVHSERVREIPQFLRTKIEDMWNHQRHIGVIAAVSVQESREEEDTKVSEQKDAAADSGAATEEQQRLRKFGPFESVTEPTQCGRCALFMPSIQCGNEVCTKTKWCRVCTKVSIHLGGNVQRECMNLRKSQDKEVAKGVGKLMEEVWNDGS